MASGSTLPRCSTPRRICWALLFAGAALFLAWSPSSEPRRWTEGTARSFYHELTDAFLHGQIHLQRSPDARLIALPDPYDPRSNEAYRVNDLSLFEGRYYLYHSAAPVVTLLLPFKILTGAQLGESAAVFLFILGGFIFASLALREFIGRFAPGAPAYARVLGITALATCQGYEAILRIDNLNLVPIAAASFWLMGALHFLLRATARVDPWNLACASLCCGLAIAARPNYLFGSVALAIPLAIAATESGVRSRRFRMSVAAAVVPVAVILVLIVGYNHFRFHQLGEFGARYMLGAWDQRLLAVSGVSSLKENFYYYLVAPPQYHADFPYLTPSSWQSTGLLLRDPWLLLGIGAIGVAALSPAKGIRAAIAAISVPALANLGFLLFLPSGNNEAVLTSANARYAFDFQPALALLAALGTIVLASRIRPGIGRAAFGVAAASVFVVSALSALSLDLARFPASDYGNVADVLGAPGRWFDRSKDDAYGPIALDVVLPSEKTGGFEPLVSTGDDSGGALVYVNYVSPREIKVGLVGVGLPGPISEPIPIDFGRPHRVEIHLGSLVPQDGNPLLGGLSKSQAAIARRRVVVRIDGIVVLESSSVFSPALPRQVSIGRTKILRDYSAQWFTGKITGISRIPIEPPPAIPEVYGAVQVKLRFPENPPPVSEPLLVSGVPQAGDMVFVTYNPDGTIRFSLDHWGSRPVVSEWVRVDKSREHTLDILLGSLLPATAPAGLPADEWRRRKEHVSVKLDGTPVIDAVQPTYVSSPYDVVTGRNVIGTTSAGYLFTGKIVSVDRIAPAP